MLLFCFNRYIISHKNRLFPSYTNLTVSDVIKNVILLSTFCSCFALFSYWHTSWFFERLLTFSLCVWLLFLCMCIRTVYLQCLQRPGEGIDSMVIALSVLGTKPRSSIRGASTLNCQVSLQITPHLMFLLICFWVPGKCLFNIYYA